MAVNLSAVFRVRDQGTSVLRRISDQLSRVSRATRTATQSSNTYRDANGRLRNSLGHFVTDTSRASTATGSFATRINGLRVGTNGLSASLGGMQSALAGIAGAYLTAQGAAKAFEMTIGAAAKYQQSEVAVKAIFNDDEASSAYLAMVDKMAIDSPLLNSGDMLGSSKGLVAMTKNVKDLGNAWSIIEKLMVLDPTQGTEGAAFALKEMWQGDSLSMVERFGLNKGELNKIKKMSIPKQISEINKLLDGMGITQKTVEAMGSTTLGYWSQIGERAEKFGRTIGTAGNTKLSEVLGSIVDRLDNADLDGIAQKVGDKLGGIIDKAIKIGEFLWEWREPISYVVGALATALGAFAVIGTLSLLANPISLIAAGIAGAAFGMIALYNNSETFRNAIDGVVGKVKELWTAFSEGGTSGLIKALFPPDVAEKVNGFIDGVKSKFSELTTAFNEGGVMGVLSSLLPPGVVEEITSFVDTIKAQIGEVIPFLTEKFEQIKPSFDTLKDVFTQVRDVVMEVFPVVWGVIEPILSNVWSVIKKVADIATLAFNYVIVPALALVSAAFQAVWAVVGPILEFIGAAIELAFGVLQIVWDTIIAPFAAFLMGGFSEAINFVMPIIEGIGGAFETVGGWISKAADFLSSFAEKLKSVKVPEWMSNLGGGVVSFATNLFGGGKADGSHYHGLGRVPYDGYLASLHRNEMVLTAQEAEQYRSVFGKSTSDTDGAFSGVTYEQVERGITNNQTSNYYNAVNNTNSGDKVTQPQRSISIAKLAEQIIVREDADIEKIAYDLAKHIEKVAMQIG